jgi:hypothetical protein
VSRDQRIRASELPQVLQEAGDRPRLLPPGADLVLSVKLGGLQRTPKAELIDHAAEIARDDVRHDSLGVSLLAGMQVNTGGVPAVWNASLPVAVALVLASFAPVSIVLLWLGTSASAWRRMAERMSLNLLVLVVALGGLVLGNVGTAWVYNDLIGSSRRAEQRVIYVAMIAMNLLCAGAIGLAKQRRGKAILVRSLPSRSQLTPRIALVVLLIWAGVVGAFAMWKFGPSATEPASPEDRVILKVAGGAIAVLVVVLVRVIRRARRLAGRPGGAMMSGTAPAARLPARPRVRSEPTGPR